jgi:hypothetical protein
MGKRKETKKDVFAWAKKCLHKKPTIENPKEIIKSKKKEDALVC